MRPTLHTERLTLVPVTDEHLPLMVELNGDPEVMGFLRGRPATPEETYDEWARRLGPQTDEERGLGYWAGFEHDGSDHDGSERDRVEGERVEDDVFVGWWSASSFASDASRAGIGYRLRRDAWGRGLATEGARALVGHAFTVPGVERVVASTMAVNLASRQVMEKLGMAHVRTYVGEWDDPIAGWEQGEVVYELTRADARSSG